MVFFASLRTTTTRYDSLAKTSVAVQSKRACSLYFRTHTKTAEWVRETVSEKSNSVLRDEDFVFWGL